ncbi:MAG: hypothetical protein J6C40_06835 [Lentisphaeria bacterium]|nr:hypothetical protein [Lentisphaeria bacterium]
MYPAFTHRISSIYSNIIAPTENKPEEDCPDAPRYKACGNSMAVNCMMWLGERIQAEDENIQKGNLNE